MLHALIMIPSVYTNGNPSLVRINEIRKDIEEKVKKLNHNELTISLLMENSTSYAVALSDLVTRKLSEVQNIVDMHVIMYKRNDWKGYTRGLTDHIKRLMNGRHDNTVIVYMGNCAEEMIISVDIAYTSATGQSPINHSIVLEHYPYNLEYKAKLEKHLEEFNQYMNGSEPKVEVNFTTPPLTVMNLNRRTYTPDSIETPLNEDGSYALSDIKVVKIDI